MIVSSTQRRRQLRFGVDYSASNPYQSLLYQSISPEWDARPATLRDALFEFKERGDPLVYHLHWEEHVLKHAADEQAGNNAQAMLDALDDLAVSGTPIVWTRHNRTPHDNEHEDLHRSIVSHLNEMATCVHLHSQVAAEELSRHEELPLSKTVIIGHGNYEGCYPSWSTAKSRSKLDISPSAHVFLVFGRLANYKQILDTAKAFVSADSGDSILLVAGVLDDPDIKDGLPKNENIRLCGYKIDDAEVGAYFGASDTVILPYRDSLTSGTACLASTLGRGVLGFECAGLRDVIRNGSTGLLIDPEALADTIEVVVKEGRDVWKTRGQAARHVALQRDWRSYGVLWRAVLNQL